MAKTCARCRFGKWLVGLALVLLGAPSVGAAARSTKVIFHNQTTHTLELIKASLSHGKWTVQPPKSIPPKKQVSWASESNGIATGTEGTAAFRVQGGGEVHLWWDNPYVGADSYGGWGPAGYQLPSHGGSGKNATVDWVFKAFVIPPLPSKPINKLEVRIVTSKESHAGNKSYKYFDIGPLGWKLMPENHPQGSDRTHNLDLHGLKITTDDIVWLRLQKKGMEGLTGSADGPNGEWKPESIHLKVNGEEFVHFEVNEWLRQAQPSWTVGLRPSFTREERFAHVLRLMPNNRLKEKDKLSGFLTTPLAKRNGLSGWKGSGIPVTFATGKVVWMGESTDGLATIDLAVEKVVVGGRTVFMDGKHGVNHQRYLRVEYEHKKNPVPRAGQRVEIGGNVFWDTDDEWYYEIHPRGPNDVKVLH